MSRPREAYIADILARVPDDDDAERNAAYAECKDCQARDFDECVHYEGPGPMCCGCKQDVILDDSGGDWTNGVDVCNTCTRDEHDLLVDEVRALRAERDEARAEIAALRGHTGGAISERWTWDGYETWVCRADVDIVSITAWGTSWSVSIERDEHDTETLHGKEEPSCRAAMRAAEAAARSRGWM
jgi:hypothetical protein